MPTDERRSSAVSKTFTRPFAATELLGISYDPSRPADDRIDFEVTLHPSSGFTPGIGRLSVTGSSADGRMLEFSARLYVVEGSASEAQDLEAWNIGAVGVLPCAPQRGRHGRAGQPPGFDTGYQGTTLGNELGGPDGARSPGDLAAAGPGRECRRDRPGGSTAARREIFPDAAGRE